MSSFTTTGGNSEYFKVCWTQVLELVRQRKVFLCDGFAYVLPSDVIFGICQMFRSELSLELTVSYLFYTFNRDVSVFILFFPPYIIILYVCNFIYH